jgi:hypothetical protein
MALCSCNFYHQEKSTPEFKMEMEELRIESVDPSSAITQNLILGLRTVKGKGQSFYKLQIIDEYPSQRTIYSQLFDQAFNIVELFTFDYISQGCITHDSLKLKMVPLERHVLDGVVSVTSFNHGGKRSQIWLHGFQEFEDVIDVSLPLDLFKNSKEVFIVLQVSFPCAISPIYRAFWCHNGWRKSIYYDIDDIGGKEGDKLPVASPYLWYQNHLSLKEQKNLRNSFHRDGYNYFYISEDDLSMFPKCETLN